MGNQLCADTGCQNTDQANVLFSAPTFQVNFQNFSHSQTQRMVCGFSLPFHNKWVL
jgi:hypothetical protein